MRLSHRTIYGLRAIVDLAYHGGDEPVQAREIAERAQIPGQFLGQIFQDLKRAEIVASKRGPGGGYFLVSKPQELSLARILEVLEDLPELPEMAKSEGSVSDLGGVAAVADGVCGELVARMVDLFREVTVADLVEQGEALGVPRQGYEGFVYVI
jgi:Rrf2 family transcriptional regulator, iron-sulfur cluster assembly transcription factor